MLVSYLDRDPVAAARGVDDMRTAKLCLESAQLLCGLHHLLLPEAEPPPYRLAHRHHPYYAWLFESRENSAWLAKHARALYNEHHERFGTRCKTGEVLAWLDLHYDRLWEALPAAPFTEPPLLASMPEAAKRAPSRVEAYRIHAVCKPRFRWERAEPPEWWEALTRIHRPECIRAGAEA